MPVTPPNLEPNQPGYRVVTPELHEDDFVWFETDSFTMAEDVKAAIIQNLKQSGMVDPPVCVEEFTNQPAATPTA